MLVYFFLSNKDLSPSFMNIGSSTFLVRYEYTCFTAKESKMLNVLSASGPYFHWNNYISEIFYRKSVMQIVWGIYSFCPEVD